MLWLLFLLIALGESVSLSCSLTRTCYLTIEGFPRCIDLQVNGSYTIPAALGNFTDTPQVRLTSVRAANYLMLGIKLGGDLVLWGASNTVKSLQNVLPQDGPFIQASVGRNTLCAVNFRMRAYCGGMQSNKPIPVQGIPGVAQIEVEQNLDIVCWRYLNGTVACNNYQTASFIPPNDVPYRDFSCAESFCCGLGQDDLMRCWAILFAGPDPVPTLPMVSIGCGSSICCGILKTNGSVLCYTHGFTNIYYRYASNYNATGFSMVCGAQGYVAAVETASARLVAWNSTYPNEKFREPEVIPNDTNPIPLEPYDPNPLVQPVLCSSSQCARTSKGELVCYAGQLGSFLIPAPPGPFLDITGWNAFCGIDNATRFCECWGVNTLIATKSIKVPLKSIAQGRDILCGIRQADDFIVCTGASNVVPDVVPALLNDTTYAKIVAGVQSFCAIKTNKSIMCLGAFNPSYIAPTRDVPSGGTYLDVALHADVVCAIDNSAGTSGAIHCFGNRSTIVNNIPAGNQWVQIKSGRSTSSYPADGLGPSLTFCVRDVVGQIVCWGNNLYGEGSPPLSAIPGVGLFDTFEMLYTMACGILKTGGMLCWGATVNQFNLNDWPIYADGNAPMIFSHLVLSVASNGTDRPFCGLTFSDFVKVLPCASVTYAISQRDPKEMLPRAFSELVLESGGSFVSHNIQLLPAYGASMTIRSSIPGQVATIDCNLTSCFTITTTNVTFRDIRFTNANTSAVSLLLGAVFERCVFDSNAGSNGGAIANSGYLVLINTTFINNSANFGGGALYSIGDVRMSGCNFTSNFGQTGGAVCVSAGSLDVRSTTFIKNDASIQGGGIYAQQTPVTLRQTSFVSNTANRGGGAFFIGVNVWSNEVTMDKNSAARGGGFYLESTSATITQFQATDNQASDSGGVFYSSSSTLSFSNNSQFTSNSAGTGSGGWGFIEASSLFAENCNILGNAASSGAGLSAQDSNVMIDSSIFENNIAKEKGGALRVQTSTEVTFNLLHTTLKGNQAGLGGAFYAESVEPSLPAEVANCTFLQNIASIKGAALFLSQFPLRFYQSNYLLNNNADECGAGIYYEIIPPQPFVPPDPLSLAVVVSFEGNSALYSPDISSAPQTLDLTNPVVNVSAGVALNYSFELLDVLGNPVARDQLNKATLLLTSLSGGLFYRGASNEPFIQGVADFSRDPPLRVFGASGGPFSISFQVENLRYQNGSSISLTFQTSFYISPCANATYFDPLVSYCAPCPEGNIADKNGTCRPCPPGTYSDIALEECVDCPPGFYAKTGSQPACTMCGPGFYCPNSTTVASCPPGTFSDNAVNGNTFCPQCAPGTYIDVGSQSVCKMCGSGTYCNTSTEIRNCPPGTWSIGSSVSRCELCIPGKYNGGEGKAQCEECPAGSYCPGYGATSPIPCGHGNVSDPSAVACRECAFNEVTNNNSTRCLFCESGKKVENHTCIDCEAGFASVPNGTACEICPAGKFSSHSRATSCSFCQAGTQTIAPYEGLHECVPCVGSTASPDLTRCICTNGYFNVNDNKSAPANCTRCPVGSICDDASSITSLQAAPGYWRSSTSSLIFGKCLDANHCPGGAFAEQCAENREGPLCTQCVDGTSEWAGQCVSCKEPNGGLIFAFLIVSMLLVLGLHVVSQVTTGLTKVFFYFSQTVYLFTSQFDSMRWSYVFNFEPQTAATICVAPISPYQKLGLSLLLPLIMLGELLLIMAILFVRHLYRNSKREEGKKFYFSWNPYIRTLCALALFSYMLIVGTAFKYLNCVDVGPEGEYRVVDSAPGIDCRDSRYQFWFILAILIIVLYGFVFPVTMVIVLTYVAQSHHLGGSFGRRWGVLFDAYRIQAQPGPYFEAPTYWWEGFVLLRRALLVMVDTLLFNNLVAKFSVFTALSLVFLILHLLFLPFADPQESQYDNKLETASLTLLFLTAFVLAGRAASPEGAVQGIIFVIAGIPTFLFFLYYIFAKGKNVLAKMKRIAEKQRDRFSSYRASRSRLSISVSSKLPSPGSTPARPVSPRGSGLPSPKATPSSPKGAPKTPTTPRSPKGMMRGSQIQLHEIHQGTGRTSRPTSPTASKADRRDSEFPDAEFMEEPTYEERQSRAEISSA